MFRKKAHIKVVGLDRPVRRFNWRLIAQVTGVLLLYLSAGMLMPLAVSVYERDGMQFALAVSEMLMLM